MHARMRISAEDIGGCRMNNLRPIRDGENGLRNHKGHGASVMNSSRDVLYR